MKLSSTILALTAIGSASAKVIRGSDARALLSMSRRVEDAGDDAAQEEEMDFLQYYSLVFLKCVPGETYQNVEGNYEYSSIVYRLCPADSCSSEVAGGCSEGYGEYVVGINTYVENWMEENRDNINQDDNFNLAEYGTCMQYNFDNGDNQGDNQAAYYVGPSCSADTKSVVLGFFSDETCQTVPEVTFEDMSGGTSLPYSSSSFIETSCYACSVTNDNGEAEIADMCMADWMYSGKCEGGMSHPSAAYGADESACDYIGVINPAKAAKGNKVGAAIGWTIFVLVVLGAGGYAYTTWWMKKKSSTGMAAEGGI